MNFVDVGIYDYTKYSVEESARDIIDTKLAANTEICYLIGFVCASKYFMIVQKHTEEFCSCIIFGYGTRSIIYMVKTDGKWN